MAEGTEGYPGDRPAARVESGGFGALEELFAAALELPEGEWAGFLAAVEPAPVREELRGLLRGHASDSGLLAGDAPTTEWLRAALAEIPSGTQLPTRIGPHRILGEIGRGGMGVVYRAVAEGDGYQREVALKVLHGSGLGGILLATPDTRQRFAAERRILARLQHPNIAAMLDGGTTEEGAPWLAMELVDGLDLKAHADQNGLDLGSRLELFQKVCGAVAHAHSNLVVHRDLKPGNVLVTADGEPKLLDFGIAKLLEEGRGPDAGDATRPAMTATGTYLFTPDYSSPEQVSGDPVTTRTDVHALGLLLFELLTGERAQNTRGKSPAELVAAVCNTMPPPPSRVPGGRFAAALRGDLDAIALRALDRDPDRRYGSAQELMDDVGRWLAGLPVRARRDTFRYRAGKFIRRHRAPLAAALLAFLGVSAAAVMLYQQSEQLEQQAAQLERERNAARRESDVSQEIAGLMVGMFELPDVEAARARALTAVDLVDIARRQVVQGQLASTDPLLRASLLDALGRAYTSLSLLPRAEPLLEEALQLRVAAVEARPLDCARSRFALGRLRYLQERLAEAEQLFLAAEEALRQEDLSTESIRMRNLPMRIALNRATVADQQSDVATALIHLGRAEQLFPQEPEERAAARASWLLVRAGLSFQEGNLEEGLEWADECVAVRERVHGREHPQVAQALRLRAELHKELGRYEPALLDFRRAVAIESQGLGPDHPVVDDGRFGVAQLLHDMEMLDEAVEILEGVIARDRQRLGRHPATALAIGLLGSVLGSKGEVEGAEACLKEAISILREHPDDGGMELANALSNLGVLLLETGRTGDAVAVLDEALGIRKALYGPGHPDLLTSLSLLALTHYNSGRLDEAEPLYQQVYDGRLLALGDHPETAGALYSLGAVARARGSWTEAERLYRESAAMYGRVLPEGHPEGTRPLFALGVMWLKNQRYPEAKEMLGRVLAVRESAHPQSHPDVVGVHRYLGRCAGFMGEADVGERHYRAALEAMGANRAADGSLPEWGPFGRLRWEAESFFQHIGKPEVVVEILDR